jgi:hypothetical protein
VPICVSRPSGKSCALPYRMADAEKPITPTIENSAIGNGRPTAWPKVWSFCDRAKRVKSGMFSARVAQKPTSPVSAPQVLGPPSTTLAGRLNSCSAGTLAIR